MRRLSVDGASFRDLRGHCASAICGLCAIQLLGQPLVIFRKNSKLRRRIDCLVGGERIVVVILIGIRTHINTTTPSLNISTQHDSAYREKLDQIIRRWFQVRPSSRQSCIGRACRRPLIAYTHSDRQVLFQAPKRVLGHFISSKTISAVLLTPCRRPCGVCATESKRSMEAL